MFLVDGHRSQQQSEMGMRGKERHTQGSGQMGLRELSGTSNMDKEHWGLRTWYCASVRITYSNR